MICTQGSLLQFGNVIALELLSNQTVSLMLPPPLTNHLCYQQTPKSPLNPCDGHIASFSFCPKLLWDFDCYEPDRHIDRWTDGLTGVDGRTDGQTNWQADVKAPSTPLSLHSVCLVNIVYSLYITLYKQQVAGFSGLSEGRCTRPATVVQ